MSISPCKVHYMDENKAVPHPHPWDGRSLNSNAFRHNGHTLRTSGIAEASAADAGSSLTTNWKTGGGAYSHPIVTKKFSHYAT